MAVTVEVAEDNAVHGVGHLLDLDGGREGSPAHVPVVHDARTAGVVRPDEIELPIAVDVERSHVTSLAGVVP